MAIWHAPKMWDGGECFILGGGASMPRQLGVPEETIKKVIANKFSVRNYIPYFKPLHNKHTIGINNAYMLGSWLDCVFFGDCSWYLVHRKQLAKMFAGIKVTCCPRFEKKPKEEKKSIKYMAKDKTHKKGISENPGCVSWNGNSGSAAISLAYHLGVKRIILLGFDMCLDKSGKSHWHAAHRRRDGKAKRVKSPPFKRHLRGFSHIAEDAKRLGLEILNASPDSVIKEFRKMKLEDILK